MRKILKNCNKKKEIRKFCRILYIEPFWGCDVMDNNLLNEIRNNVDIVDIISSYIPLTPKGKNYFGVCPFHDDHSPSMSVSKERQIYTCFSCGATGNVYKFIQDYENVSFMEAVKKCADIAGISVNIKGHKDYNKYQDLYDIYELSQKFYQNNINSIKGKKAKEYLYSRHLNDEIIKEFGIGLSLGDRDILTKLLKNKYDEKTLLQSGLINEGPYDLYDVYHNRIMFPLYSLTGQVIGYNGRVYNGETENKYVNSKETQIFKKRELLYNYHRAKDFCRISKQVIIVEGPMDVIRCYSIGIKNVVAALGTAFGKEQALLIRKLSSEVILLYDGDDAGLKGTKITIEELQKIGIQPKVVRLEDNLDPDEYILTKGKQAFMDKINNPLNVMEFKSSLLKMSSNLNNSEELAKYANNMINEISKIDDEVLREISINKLSEETKLDKEFIKDKILSLKPIEEVKITTKKVRLSKYEKSEQALLYYMLKDENIIKIYDKKITHMPTPKYRHLAFQISYFYKQHGFINEADLLTELREDEEAINTIGEINMLNLRSDCDVDAIYDYLNNIKEYNEKSEVAKYKQELKNELDLNKKVELALKAISFKVRREEENE